MRTFLPYPYPANVIDATPRAVRDTIRAALLTYTPRMDPKPARATLAQALRTARRINRPAARAARDYAAWLGWPTTDRTHAFRR